MKATIHSKIMVRVAAEGGNKIYVLKAGENQTIPKEIEKHPFVLAMIESGRIVPMGPVATMKKESAKAVADAETKAEKIIADAEEKAEKIVADAEERAADIMVAAANVTAKE